MHVFTSVMWYSSQTRRDPMSRMRLCPHSFGKAHNQSVQEILLSNLSRNAKMFKISQAHCTGPLFLIQMFSSNHLYFLPPCSARWRTTKPIRHKEECNFTSTLSQPKHNNCTQKFNLTISDFELWNILLLLISALACEFWTGVRKVINSNSNGKAGERDTSWHETKIWKARVI